MMRAGVLRAAEVIGIAGWLCAAFAMCALPALAQAVAMPHVPFTVLALGMAALNALSIAWRGWTYGTARTGHPWSVSVDTAIARARRAPGTQWLGRGFDWTPLHAQRMQRALHAGRGAPPARLVDSVEPRPGALFVPAAALSSHTLVFGQTGAGKTRLAELLVTSFLARHRDAVVLIIDPKGDQGLQSVLARACAATGRTDALVTLHPAFPEQSVRFDPLRNFARASSIATRITSLLPSDGQGDAFVQFAWRAVNRLVEAMVYAGVRPTLVSLRRCLEDDARPLLAQVLGAWEARNRNRPAGAAAVEVAGARAGSGGTRTARGRPAVVLEPRLAAAVARYRERVGSFPGEREAVVDGLLSLVMHDPVHLSKMIQNVLPLMTALTSGVLGPLLSPDASDGTDRRPVFDARKVIDQRRCLYLGLDALVDPVVAGAIGAIVLADLAQVAGELFNDRSGAPRVPVMVFVDEAAEVVNAPLVQLLNKSRAAGFSICLAAQTVHDYEARLGNAAAARMLLGNPGNVIALRTVDLDTQRFCAGSLAPVSVESVAQSRSIGIRSLFDENGAASSIGVRRDFREVPLFAPEWLGLLPDLHFVARIAGGRTVKGELPRLTEPVAVGRPARAAGGGPRGSAR
ncbi:MAG: conjugative transfer system coupling protein TraD [Rhodocyclaceae bacterium]|nr:conjugative transfer system coupling protein TraD [Rhodocyclaceae bacterium]MCA3108366.1 conjugative transfer system coupling protein TraD [Rhodocyclaceae bacterium]MCA3108749.1 conjugative transfer system coupling protein TraD [Rhodocyclaceae bacterium]MCA3113177.1 conjugative transfer system coupling protein TraD [Rhodocyclaceae bacterium]